MYSRKFGANILCQWYNWASIHNGIWDWTFVKHKWRENGKTTRPDAEMNAAIDSHAPVSLENFLSSHPCYPICNKIGPNQKLGKTQDLWIPSWSLKSRPEMGYVNVVIIYTSTRWFIFAISIYKRFIINPLVDKGISSCPLFDWDDPHSPCPPLARLILCIDLIMFV